MNTLRLLLATCACALAFAADRKPNILVIVSDDQGYADVGFNGGKAVPTPHLDALAASGMRFTNAYAMPVCSPTRCAPVHRSCRPSSSSCVRRSPRSPRSSTA